MATKISRFDETSIESLRHMLSYGIDKNEAIKNACEITQITSDFMREFSEYMTVDIFSKSAMLSMDMINEYPMLFDRSIWVEGEKPDIDLLFDPSFYNLYGCKLTSDELHVIDRHLLHDIDKEKMDMYISAADDGTKLILFSHAIDNMTDDEIIRTVTAYKTCLRSAQLNKRMTSDMAKAIIECSNEITLSFVLSVLIMTKDIGLIKQVIDDPSNLVVETETNNKLWQQICEYLPENILAQVIALGETYCPNAIGYSTLAFCLKYKEFEEDDLLLIINSFKRNNLVKAVSDYAKARDYENVLCLLVLST